MEFIWYLIASIGAGIGTGLAGLSAATVMVPILIVLCPSFSGETGAYQATAIALASDILGSAVTTWTYARHKNIDLRRGWIMLVCILTMCMVGSWAAYLAGNVVLGTFTLFLTFAIGIGFLVKPDTTREDAPPKGSALDWKGVLISLFFGLTIGFGTGFVGTGGGMMMLVVFTVFLGMDLKTAVGTSTFIMTFTALIASVSHILIHPAILFEKWDVLLLCMAVATVCSLVSARFANRVPNRTVGLVTGAVLTVLGLSMLLLHFRLEIAALPFFRGICICLLNLIVYIVPSVLILLAIRFLTHLPSFVFRKLLHIVAFTCFTIMMLSTRQWEDAALTCLLLAAVIYPLLALAERFPWYGPLFVQKSPGEVKRSMVMLFLMFAAVISLACGLLGQPVAAAAAILMWGLGDAVAALIGIPFGKHKVLFPPVCGKKSWEGSAAMLAVSLLAGTVLLSLFGGVSVPYAMLCAACTALLGTLVELLSPSEWDTVTVPVAMLIVLLLML